MLDDPGPLQWSVTLETVPDDQERLQLFPLNVLYLWEFTFLEQNVSVAAKAADWAHLNRDHLCFSRPNAEVSDLLTPSGDAANYSSVTMRGTSGCQVKCLCFAFLDTVDAGAPESSDAGAGINQK